MAIPWVRVSLITAVSLGVVGGAAAGELTGSGGSQGWTSTACLQPVAPDIDKTDAAALNASINRYNRFVAAVDQYNRCLRSEADADISTIRNMINDEVRALQEVAIRDAEALRAAVATPREDASQQQ